MPVPCRECGTPIGDTSPYYERAVGPRCGGRIKTGRRPAVCRSPAVRVVVEETDDQMALFEVMIVRVAA